MKTGLGHLSLCLAPGHPRHPQASLHWPCGTTRGRSKPCPQDLGVGVLGCMCVGRLEQSSFPAWLAGGKPHELRNPIRHLGSWLSAGCSSVCELQDSKPRLSARLGPEHASSRGGDVAERIVSNSFRLRLAKRSAHLRPAPLLPSPHGCRGTPQAPGRAETQLGSCAGWWPLASP